MALGLFSIDPPSCGVLHSRDANVWPQCSRPPTCVVLACAGLVLLHERVVGSDQGRDGIPTGSLFPSCTCSSRGSHLQHFFRPGSRSKACIIFSVVSNRDLIEVVAALSHVRLNLEVGCVPDCRIYRADHPLGWTPDSPSDSRKTRTC